ncbi:uncharacterized protein LOC143274766 [Babylonia areolata]|uniref:uncharacterized protein LOC143274766 n=1 Tax=Babylonia areolata TaxID=304850 RepID=UPI003FD165E4
MDLVKLRDVITDSVTLPSSTTAQTSGNSSLALLQNSSQGVDLEAINLSITISLTPTIVYIATLMAVGLTGNTLAFLIYYRRFKPSATRTYILAISVCDLLTNALFLPNEILGIRYTFTFDRPWLCKTVRGFNSFVNATSAFVLVAVARDRYEKICRPHDKPKSLRRIRLNVALCAVTSLALSVFYGVLTGSRTVPVGVGNATGVMCSISDHFRGTRLPLVYSVLMALAFSLGMAIMAVSYLCIALKLRRHRDRQKWKQPGPAPVAAAKDSEHLRQVLSPAVPEKDPANSEGKKSSPSAELTPLQTAAHSDTAGGPKLDSQVTWPSSQNLAGGGGGGGGGDRHVSPRSRQPDEDTGTTGKTAAGTPPGLPGRTVVGVVSTIPSSTTRMMFVLTATCFSPTSPTRSSTPQESCPTSSARGCPTLRSMPTTSVCGPTSSTVPSTL